MTGRIFRLICVLVPMMFAAAPPLGSAPRQQNIDDLRGLSLKNAKIPIFNRSRLQMMVFSGRAERRGEAMVGIDTVLEIIRRDANADDISDGWDLKPYRLDATLPEVLDFWRSRISYCDGVMTTPECEVDQIRHRAAGSHEVHFRSPALDLDGVGFEADFDRRTIAVNSQVRLVIRQKSADPETLLASGKLPEKYEYITAVGDSLLIDSRRNEVMLIGNVRVDEERAFMTCDRLTVFWGGKRENAGADTDSPISGASGIDQILADGDVVITRKANPREQVFSDHLVCNVPAATVKLSGDDKFPRIVSAGGEVISGRELFFERRTRRGLITGGCSFESAPSVRADGTKTPARKLTSQSGFFDGINNYNDFTGGVKLVNGDQVLNCDKMRIITADRDAGTKQTATAAAADGVGSMLGTEELASGGSKEIKKAYFYDKVVLVDGANGTLRCEEMHADFAKSENGGKPELSHARCFRNVSVENRGDAAGGELPGMIKSDRLVLDYQGNKVTFHDRVRGRRGKSTLDCEQLDLHLAEKRSANGGTGTAAIGSGGGKTLKRAVASRKVHTADASGTLDCDELTLLFTEPANGEKPNAGMLHSGSLKLTDIIARGHVVAVNTASASSQAKKGFFSGKSSGNRTLRADAGKIDLERNVSHFKDHVSVNDDESTLTCDELFVYAVKNLPEPKLPGHSPAEDPDADPFALPEFTEDTVPSTVNITDDVRLHRVLSTGNVHLVRIDAENKHRQEAGGDRGEYLAGDRTITLTDTPPRRPWIRAEGRQQFGDKIIFDLRDMTFRSHGADTFTYDPTAGGKAR